MGCCVRIERERSSEQIKTRTSKLRRRGMDWFVWKRGCQ